MAMDGMVILGMFAGGSITFTRNTEQDSTVYYSGTISSTMYGNNTGNWYDYPVTFKMYVGGNLVDSGTIFNYSNSNYDYNKHSVKIGGSFKLDNNNTSVTVVYYCNYNNIEGGCNTGTPSTTTFTLPAGALYYNPYSEPTSYNLTVSPTIGKVDNTTFSGSHSITLGSGGVLDWVLLLVFPYTSWNYGRWDYVSSSVRNSVLASFNAPTSASGTTNFTLSSGTFSDGARYKVAIRFSDNHYEWISGDDDTIYTYLKPIMTNITNFEDPFSPQDNVVMSWYTNSRMWTSMEEEFQTNISNGDVSLPQSQVSQAPTNSSSNGYSNTSTQAKTITKEVLNALFSNEDRSVSVMHGTLVVDRISTSGGYRAWASTTIDVQYQPVKAPLNGTITNSSGTSVAGNTIVIQDTPTITLDWTYPITSGAAGVVDGYVIRIYKDSNYSQQVGNAKIVNVTQNASSGTCELNTKSDLSRGVMNYVKITPFYTKPNGTGRIEGTQSLQMRLVLPISRINTPVISYPVNNSNWHNKNFRILLQLPSDDDIDVLGLTDSEYRYQDIDVKITPNNNSSNAITYTYKNNPEIFSTETISHTKKIAINPSLVTSFPDVTTYKIEIRVQKNYYVTTGSKSYSKWSSAVVIKNTPVNTLNLTSGQIIEDDHYKYVRDASVRLHATYPISALNKNNIAQTNGDQIDFKEYDAISSDIVLIRQNVNNYCTYDTSRVTVRFQNNISTIKGKREIITAEKEDAELSGRNYLNILIDDMNLLV